MAGKEALMPRAEGFRAFVSAMFDHLAKGDAAAFFEHVSPNVDWTVMGTHPLAGRYASLADFRRATFDRLGPCLREPIRLRLTALHVDGSVAVAELAAEAEARNGRPFDNRYCWVMEFDQAVIVRVRAYLDSAMVARLIAENEPAA